MKISRILPIALLVILCLFVQSSFARGGGGGGRGPGGGGGGGGFGGGGRGNNNGNNSNGNYNNNNGNNGNANQQQNQADTSKDTAAIIAARKEVAASNTEVEKAESNLNTIAVNLRSAFESSPDYVAALAAQTQAQAEYDAAANAAKAHLADNAAYQSALKQKAKTEKEIDAMHQRGESGEDVMKATQQSIQFGAEVHRLEGEALLADPKVADAKGKLVAATTKVSTMRKEFETSVHQNTVWQTSKTALDEARAKHQKAQLALTQLLNGGKPLPATPDAPKPVAAN